MIPTGIKYRIIIRQPFQKCKRFRRVTSFFTNGDFLAAATPSGGKVRFAVDDPDLWNAEHPALYTLILSTPDEVIAQKVGLRRIDIKGNVIYINGVNFKIKGTNRHDSNPFTGAAVTRMSVN